MNSEILYELITKAICEEFNDSTKKSKVSFKEERLKEHSELKTKIHNLIDVLYNPNAKLDSTEYSFMTNQLSNMLQYLSQLTGRIIYSTFKNSKQKE